MRKQSLAGALLVVGLLVFGLRLGNLAWQQETLPLSAIPTAPPGPGITGTSLLKANSAPIAAGSRPSPPAGRRLSPRRVSAALLEIEVDHKFIDANLSIWVDDLLTYTHPLEGTEKRHLVMFHQVQGHEFHAMQIPPGKHLLKVKVSSAAGLSEQDGAIEGNFVSGQETMLRISFDNRGQMSLSLQ